MKIKLHDRTFELSVPAADIDKVIAEMGAKMNKDLAGKRPLFLCVLNGSFMFASDLMKHITVEGAEISFVKLTSYAGTESVGTVRELIGLTENLEGRTVVIMEDIVDTGITMHSTKATLHKMNPKEILISTLFFKPDSLQRELTLDYVGIDIPNDFIVGRGLDYDGLGRNYPDLYTVCEE
ncbi:MAG: phosphoribosyltransferase family protein [Marinifilaceae bacterium]